MSYKSPPTLLGINATHQPVGGKLPMKLNRYSPPGPTCFSAAAAMLLATCPVSTILLKTCHYQKLFNATICLGPTNTNVTTYLQAVIGCTPLQWLAWLLMMAASFNNGGLLYTGIYFANNKQNNNAMCCNCRFERYAWLQHWFLLAS